jgi:hypothetical protein
MNKILFALVITVMATAANARGNDQFSFLQCGVKFGGKYLTYKASSEGKKRKDTRFNHIAGAVKSESSGFTLSDASTASLPTALKDTSLSVEFRLPRKVNVATVGCSWL